MYKPRNVEYDVYMNENVTATLIETFKTETRKSFEATNLTDRFAAEDAANVAAEALFELDDAGDAEAEAFVRGMLALVESIRKSI